MDGEITEVVHYTPKAEELQPYYTVQCSQPDCASIFTNMGNYDMHLQRHHKLLPRRRRSQHLFNCPVASCIYNVAHGGDGKSFKSMKYLRQHYHNLHGEKIHKCERCAKKFPTPGQLTSHTLNECGKQFSCLDCGWQYENMCALLTHAKRKGHRINRETRVRLVVAEGVVAADSTAGMDVPSKLVECRATQTEEILVPLDLQQNDSKRQCAASVQTDLISLDIPAASNATSALTPIPKEFDYTRLLARDTHTQTDRSATCNSVTSMPTNMPTNMPTERDGDRYRDRDRERDRDRDRDIDRESDREMQRHRLRDTDTCTVTATATASDIGTSTAGPGSTIYDPMFAAQPTHITTQTCDDFLTDFVLVNMQTQTNWSRTALPTTATASTSTNCAYDELLVSTETQTSFTQCLLDSRATSADLYTTQYTQTCEGLLGELFGAQESDYIGGFQSAYTQT